MVGIVVVTRAAVLIARRASTWTVDEHLAGLSPGCVAVDLSSPAQVYCGTAAEPECAEPNQGSKSSNERGWGRQQNTGVTILSGKNRCRSRGSLALISNAQVRKQS